MQLVLRFSLRFSMVRMLLSGRCCGGGPPSQSIVWPQSANFIHPMEERICLTEYFEQRNAPCWASGTQPYAAPQQTAERGVTVSALRTTPERFAQRRISRWNPRPSGKAAFVVHQPDFKPDGIRTTMRGRSIRRSPRLPRQDHCWGTAGMRVPDCAAPGGKAASWRRHCRARCAGEQRVRGCVPRF